MAAVNVHERTLPVPAAKAGALLDSLASEDDQLWPVDYWHPMRLDRPLGVGGRGGHGPIKYEMIAYVPGRWARFEFTRPHGFHGFHEFVVLDCGDQTTIRHTLTNSPRGLARLSWPLVFRWLHDALLEDCLDVAERNLTGGVRKRAHRNRWVQFLRRF